MIIDEFMGYVNVFFIELYVLERFVILEDSRMYCK